MPAASVLELRQMVRQCVGDVIAEQYARKNAPGQRSLFGGEKLASDKTQGKFRWVTIGGEPGEKGEHEGGTPIKIEKATGAIVAGPKALAEKGIKKVSDFGKSESERQQQGSKSDGSDSGAAKTGPGMDEKRQPAGVVGADESTERTPPAKTHDPYAAALSEVKGVVEAADMGTAAGEFEAMRRVVDIGKKHGVSANELWREATWSANHRDIEAEVSGEADERAAERGSGLQSGDWDAKLKALQKQTGNAVSKTKIAFNPTAENSQEVRAAQEFLAKARPELTELQRRVAGYADELKDREQRYSPREIKQFRQYIAGEKAKLKSLQASVAENERVVREAIESQPTAAANQQDAEVGHGFNLEPSNDDIARHKASMKGLPIPSQRDIEGMQASVEKRVKAHGDAAEKAKGAFNAAHEHAKRFGSSEQSHRESEELDRSAHATASEVRDAKAMLAAMRQRRDEAKTKSAKPSLGERLLAASGTPASSGQAGAFETHDDLNRAIARGAVSKEHAASERSRLIAESHKRHDEQAEWEQRKPPTPDTVEQTATRHQPAASGGSPSSAPALPSRESVVKDIAEKVAKRLVEDFGEHIPGARKELSAGKSPSPKKTKSDDERPAWARRYQVAQVAKSSRASEVGKWTIDDTKQKDRWTGGAKKATDQLFDSKEAAEAAIPLLEVARNHRVIQTKKGEPVDPVAYEKWQKDQEEWANRLNSMSAASSSERMRLHDQRPQRPPFKNEEWAIARDVSDRKRPIVKGGFASRDEAMAHMASHPESIIEHKFPNYETYKYLDDVQRKGPKYRDGNVKPDDFQKAFGVRGGQFGNWNSGKDGQESLNHAYDSFMDLADVLKVDPKAIALNGDLAMAFGARGTGGKDAALAHYEPDLRVINLTKMKGAGSLAHEWSHALDHFVHRAAGVTDGHGISEPSYKAKTRPEVKAAAKELIDTMMGKSETTAVIAKKREEEHEVDRVKAKLAKEHPHLDWEETRKTLSVSANTIKDHMHNLRVNLHRMAEWKKKTLKPEDLKEFDALSERIANGDYGPKIDVETKGGGRFALGRSTYENLEKLNQLHAKMVGRGFHTKEEHSEGNKVRRAIDTKLFDDSRAKASAEGATETRRVHSDFLREARRLDETTAGDYYALSHEMFARAFESYVDDKLKAADRRSDYLIGQGSTNAAKYRALMGASPFPDGDERKAINAAFDKFFDAVRGHELPAAKADKNSDQYSRRDLRGMVRYAIGNAVRERYARAWNEADHPRGQPENAGEFAPKGAIASQPSDAIPATRKGAIDEIASRAKVIQFTEDRIDGEPVDRYDNDAILARMPDLEIEQMEDAFDGWRDDWVNDQVANRFEPSVDFDDLHEGISLTDRDITTKCDELIDELEDVDDDEKERLKELNAEWYSDTEENGPDAIYSLQEVMRDNDAPEALIDALKYYRSDAIDNVKEAEEAEIERQEEEFKDSIRDDYDDSNERTEYLRSFYDDHKSLFAGEPAPDGHWGRDDDGDRAMRFSVSDQQFEILAYERQVASGVKALNVSFSDESGSYAITGKLGARGAAEVFRTVSASVLALVQQENPNAMEFTAAEPSRQSLYDKLTKTVTAASPDYAAVAITSPGKPKTYVVAKKHLLPGYVEKIGTLGLLDAKLETLVKYSRKQHDSKGRRHNRTDQAGIRSSMADRAALGNGNRSGQSGKSAEKYERQRESHVTLRDRIASAAAQTDRNPTDEQKKAGNYRKGKFWLWGHEVAIENPKGSTRSGTSRDGKAWSVTMGAHYGYIRRTLSKADGDAVDCFIGPHPESEVVFVVNQCKPSGKFDEHKCVIGCRSISEAKKLYLSCYSAGWQGMQSIVPMTKPQFLKWLERGDTTRAVKFNDSIERYDRSSDLAAKLERMGLKPTPGMVSAFEKAYERRKLKDMGQEIPEHLKQGRPFEEALAETPAAKAQAVKEAEKQARQNAKQAKKAPQPKPQEPVVGVPAKPKRQPGDGTPGWQRVGGAPVFVNGDGKIIKGCPGLKGEHVSDLIDESDDSRKRREVRNDHALAMGKDGRDFTPSQLKKLETGRNRERHEAAEKAAKKAGVPTRKVLSQMPEIEKTARSMGVKRTDAADALGDALRAIGDQYEIERMNAKEVAKAHKLAMRLTGLTPAKIHTLEDSGKDHTAVRGFDVNAYTFAAENESPFVHFDKHSGDIEQQVWEFIKSGKPEKPTLSKVASNAADMLANNIKQRLRKAGVAVAPAEDHSDEWAAMERREPSRNEDRLPGDEDEIPEHHKHASPDDEPFDKFSRRAALSIMGKLA